MKTTSVCTIIAKNYLALAKTLADSLRSVHPQVDFHTLVIDPFEFPEGDLELGKIILDSPSDFLDADKLQLLAYQYDITEFSTALKPFYLEHLLQKGYEQVIFLDPDIVIFQPIDQIFQALETSNIVLIPHILDPIPLDGHFPSEITLLQSGAYNLGFIGVAQSQETYRFLAWWGERLEKYCRIAHSEGLFVDQKWIDLVPGMFEKVTILKARGYNVAYWNLNARQLSERDGVYWVDNEPLVFFHYSGFNADNPTQLSKHQNRLKLKELPTLVKLLQHYVCLLKANGHDEYKKWPYSYSTFSNGVVMDGIARALLQDAQQSGMSFPNPRDVDAEPSFFEWLNSPVAGRRKQAGGSPKITNYLYGIYQRRLDLRGAFPDVFREHRDRYLSWVKTHATTLGIHPAFVNAAYADDKGSAPPSTVAASGVNVAGYLTAELGVGEAARGYVAALKSLGVQTALIDYAAVTSSRKEDNTLSGFSSDNPHPINLICVNADQVPHFVNHFGSGYLEQKYNIGLWAWELPDFPQAWWDNFAYFNEIWVGSTFMYQSISKHSPVPVVRMPHVIDIQLPRVYPKQYFGLAEDEFTFLFAFDFFSSFERKNPLAVVEAFKKAFEPDEPVRLVLKCINQEHDPANFHRLKNAIGNARITLVDRYLSKDEKNGLIDACDCYVSLHRAEGFGLTLAEAMFLEKPAIATAWSGNMDFMTANNSYLVDYELTSITADHGPYKRGGIWAKPCIEQAARLMREVYEHPEERQKKAKRAAADIRLMHSPTTVAELIEARLKVIHSLSSPIVAGNLAQQQMPRQPLDSVNIASSLPLAMILSSEWATQSRFGKLGLLAKKIMERLIRFYVAYQDNINRSLTAANQAVRERVEQQQEQVDTLERQMAELAKRVDALQAKERTGGEELQENLLNSNNAVREQAKQ